MAWFKEGWCDDSEACVRLLWGLGKACVPTEDAADKTEAAADPTSMVLSVDSDGIEMPHLHRGLHARKQKWSLSPQAATVACFSAATSMTLSQSEKIHQLPVRTDLIPSDRHSMSTLQTDDKNRCYKGTKQITSRGDALVQKRRDLCPEAESFHPLQVPSGCCRRHSSQAASCVFVITRRKTFPQQALRAAMGVWDN